MLKQLRKQKTAKRIFYLLAIIIVPAFTLWGVGSVAQNERKRKHAGSMFGKKVSYDTFSQALLEWRHQIRMRFGEKAAQLEQYLDPYQGAWERLIMLREVNKRHIKVNDKEVADYITSLPYLQRDGVFNEKLYNAHLKYDLDNIQARTFEEEIRQMLQFQKLFEQETQFTTVDDKEVKDRFALLTQQIKVDYIAVLFKDVEKNIKITDQELTDYFNTNKKAFTLPIQVNLYGISVEYPADASPVKKEEINNKMDEIKTFLDQTHDKAQAEQKFGVTFTETGFFSLGDPLPHFESLKNYENEGLFNLENQQTSEIIPNTKGVYLFIVKEKRTNYLPPFDELKNSIRESVMVDKVRAAAQKLIDSETQQIKEKKKADSKLSLAAIAKALSLPVKTTDFFGKDTSIADIGSYREFNEAALALGEGQISEVIELPQGYFIVQKVDAKPLDEAEFQKQKEQIKASVLQEKKTRVFEEFFAKLKQEANIQSNVETDMPVAHQKQPQALPHTVSK